MQINSEAAAQFRRLRGLTLRQVAEQTGRSIGTLSGIEHDRHGASDELVRQLAEAYDVPVAALILDPEDRFEARLSDLEARVARLEAVALPQKATR